MVGVNSILMHVHKITVGKSTRSAELRQMRDQFEDVLKIGGDHTIFVEEPVLAGMRNIRTTILIAETVGMILSYSRSVYVVPVSSWKQKTVGDGHATKEMVEKWLEKDHPTYHRLCEHDSDLVDAAAICVYGQQVMDLSRHRAPE